MRIIGGSAGGRIIRAPKGQSTRPTSDRVREAIFNVLGPLGTEARVLDLFAGSGAMGLEALSRGAKEAVFVENARPAVKCLRENLEILGFGIRALVMPMPVSKALVKLAARSQHFQLILVDAPYASLETGRTLVLLGGECGELAAPNAIIVVEHDKRKSPDERNGALLRIDRRRYGDTEVSFFTKSVAEQP